MFLRTSLSCGGKRGGYEGSSWSLEAARTLILTFEAAIVDFETVETTRVRLLLLMLLMVAELKVTE